MFFDHFGSIAFSLLFFIKILLYSTYFVSVYSIVYLSIVEIF